MRNNSCQKLFFREKRYMVQSHDVTGTSIMIWYPEKMPENGKEKTSNNRIQFIRMLFLRISIFFSFKWEIPEKNEQMYMNRIPAVRQMNQVS